MFGKKMVPPASVMMEAALSSETLATAYRKVRVIMSNRQPKVTGLHVQLRSEQRGKTTELKLMFPKYFYSKTKQMHNISNLFYLGTTFYTFRTVCPSIIRSLTVHTASGICHTGCVAAC